MNIFANKLQYRKLLKPASICTVMTTAVSDSSRMCSNYSKTLTTTNTPIWLSTRRGANMSGCECYLDAPKGTEILLGPVLVKIRAASPGRCDHWLHVWEGTTNIVNKCLVNSTEDSTVWVWQSHGQQLRWNFESNANRSNSSLLQFTSTSVYIKVLGTIIFVVIRSYCFYYALYMGNKSQK